MARYYQVSIEEMQVAVI